MQRTAYDREMMKIFNTFNPEIQGFRAIGWGSGGYTPATPIEGYSEGSYARRAYGGGTMGGPCLNRPWAFERSAFDKVMLKQSRRNM